MKLTSPKSSRREFCRGVAVKRSLGTLASARLAVVPYAETTLKLAQKIAPRAKSVGIEIELVKELGQVIDIDGEVQ